MATLSDTIILPNGSAYVGIVSFDPVSTPLTITSALVFTQGVNATTDSNGHFSITLEPGYYNVACIVGSTSNQTASFKIRIPNTTNTYALSDVIASRIERAEDFPEL